MAIIHRAYSFTPESFHARLEEKIIHQGCLQLGALLELAKEIVTDASETTWHALRDLRFDREWLDTSDDETIWPVYWYMIALASELTSVPSLSTRSRLSWAVIESFLPHIGWSEAEIRVLLRGQKLRTLVESSGNSLFIAEFTDINQFGGWLDLDEIRKLHSRFLLAEGDWSVSNVPDSLADLAALCSQDPAEMLHKAYADVMEMLRTAIDRNQALFIILD